MLSVQRESNPGSLPLRFLLYHSAKTIKPGLNKAFAEYLEKNYTDYFQ